MPQIEELNKKVDRILFHLEGDPLTKTKGIVERVSTLENGTPRIIGVISAIGLTIGGILGWFAGIMKG